AVIASMTLFLGKVQKIFQRRFNEKVPLREHKQFWKWGTVSAFLAQLVPWGYLVFATWALEKINDKLVEGVESADGMPWSAILLVGPLFLVVGFGVVFWAARGFKALGFLAKYKVPVPPVAAPPGDRLGASQAAA